MYSSYKSRDEEWKGNKQDLRTRIYQNLKGKVGIVTGASGSFGRSIAIALARNECALVITDRNEQGLLDTKQLCINNSNNNSENDNNILLVIADLRYENEIKTIAEKAIEHFQKLDFIINNAGVAHNTALDDSMEKYHEVLQIDLHSVIYLNKLVLPFLEETKGSIVNVGSIAGLRCVPYGFMPYALAKCALDHYMRLLAMELAPKGVRVNNVNPGFFRTDIFKHCDFTAEMDSTIWEQAKTWNEMMRNGELDELTGVVCFVLSSTSAQTTGVNFTMDGGFCHMCYNANPDDGVPGEMRVDKANE